MAHPEEDLSRPDDLQRASADVANRLTDLGILVTGAEEPRHLVRLLEAVEQFERAVESRGGDLMVDEGPRGHTTEPDDPHFALPRRRDDESIERYIDRLTRAIDDVLRHPPR